MARKNKQAQTIQPIAPVKQPDRKDFYYAPSSPASNLVFEVLGAGENIADLPARKQQYNHSTKLEVYEDGKRRRIESSNPKASITIELADIDKFSGSNKRAKKLFVFALIMANEQAIHDGQLTKSYVSFPLQWLINIGIYTTPQSARVGFKAGMSILTSLKIKGHIQKSKKSESTIDALEVLFTGARIENNQCTIFFNERINWSFIAQYLTMIPQYYFKLPNRASDLLYYIFYLARQHTNDIKARGYFTISFRALQYRLRLPSEIGNNNPDRTIKQPIEDALEKIEDEHSRFYNNTELSLLPVYDECASIADCLDNGYLKVELTGAFAEKFIGIRENTVKKMEAAKQKNDRIVERAKAMNVAKRLEAEEKAKKAGKGGAE